MIELVKAGRTPADLSREFECTAQTIANWVAQDARDAGKPLPGKDGLTTVEREELTRLRRQLKHVQMERDILAKGDEDQKTVRWTVFPRTDWFAGCSEKTFIPSSSS
jgi:transposase